MVTHVNIHGVDVNCNATLRACPRGGHAPDVLSELKSDEASAEVIAVVEATLALHSSRLGSDREAAKYLDEHYSLNEYGEYVKMASSEPVETKELKTSFDDVDHQKEIDNYYSTRFPTPATDVPTDDFVVGIQCYNCGWVIPRGEYPLGVEVRCRKPKCGVRLTTTDGTVLDSNSGVLEVLEADRDIYCLAADESAAKMGERAWFHITREDDWLGSVDETRGEHYPHVGSLGTVKEYYMNGGSWGKPGRIHAVKFKDGTRFADGAAIHDLNENAEWADMMRRESKTVDTVRYVNVHEYAGSVSVIAVPEVLEVTGTYEFTNPKEFNALVTQLGAMDAELLSA